MCFPTVTALCPFESCTASIWLGLPDQNEQAWLMMTQAHCVQTVLCTAQGQDKAWLVMGCCFACSAVSCATHQSWLFENPSAAGHSARQTHAACAFPDGGLETAASGLALCAANHIVIILCCLLLMASPVFRLRCSADTGWYVLKESQEG